MLDLVKYRYRFLIVSLLVLIPGIISLFVFGLKVGIDFKGGSNVTLRPQHQMTAEDVEERLKAFKLDNPQVVLGESKIPGAQIVWVRLNTVVDSKVQTAVKDKLNAKYETQLTYDVSTVKPADNKAYTLFIVSNFGGKENPKVQDIQNTLKDLPKTTEVNAPTSIGNAPAATPTAAATPKATATPKAQSTPQANATPAATPTPAANADNGTIAVKVDEVKQGQTNQTINILTLSGVSKANSSENDKDKVSLAAIQDAFLKKDGTYFQVASSSEVGPSVAGQTTLMAILAVAASSVFILLYIWFAFHKIPNAWRYGVCAIIALLHDAVIVLGIFSILGKFWGLEIDALFITALLTVIGFSVHDTIVVFDRIRENMQRHTNESFSEITNASLVQTMARSLNTSLTILFTLLALTLFTGIGTHIFGFTLALLIGIFSGTYSSIFNASMLLVIWENGELGLGRFNKKKDGEPAKREREVRELARSRG